ncbi:hypothetical protein C7999DRAFT_27831 [Corynascus novoguineensis]|uniref:Uncharacterized protein n=1 Tax=Corynascus novoguineensis TaxID=1126955 RepID=A0AAN7D3U7_9PEZI|nr:hypothetical protein C7999DRAFT_27831 [Corynascus novoguineensis]
MAYTITEPHPTVPQNSYTHSGRGGLGNFFRAPATTSPSGVPTPATLTTTASNTSSNTSSTHRFYSGRGGAGNAHRAAADRPVLSFFDEEYARAESREKSGISHVGRGGAGNIFSTSASSPSAGKGEGDDGESLGRRASASTMSSTSSSLAGFWGRMRSAGH